MTLPTTKELEEILEPFHVRGGGISCANAKLKAIRQLQTIMAKERLDELEDIDTQRDHNMSRLGGNMSETDADNLATSRIKQRIAELQAQINEKGE